MFTKDNYTCQDCNNKGCYLEAHHIIPFYKIYDDNNIKTLEQAYNCKELWNINNGITYCRECHIKNDTHRGKRGIKK